MRLQTWLFSDKMFGAAGGGLAMAAVGFGLYMNTHGPAPGGFGNSHDFTVFAQLAPHARKPAASQPARPATTDDALDTMATASIQKVSAVSGPTPDAPGAESAIIPSVTLEAASPDRATIAVDGRLRTVRVGDDVPGAGEVLEIRLGERPLLRTARGLIVSAR